MNAGNTIDPVACSEYSPELQIEILQLDLEHLIQPVLDIGCGSHGFLVKYLEKRHVDIFGIDRYKFTSANLITADWLKYDYGKEKWGTIISNLGFSNHFNHHNLRENGNYIAYARTYMNILHSLRVGGFFYYAPALPFIERYLENQQFEIKQHEIVGGDFMATTIKRLK